jgi:hypothetical protein
LQYFQIPTHLGLLKIWSNSTMASKFLRGNRSHCRFRCRSTKLRRLDLLRIIRGDFFEFSGWKCEKCDLTQNLWLNLTDGTILCGRKFYDGMQKNVLM